MKSFRLISSSNAWPFAADKFTDDGGCLVLAEAMRTGIYMPAMILDEDGYGYGDGDGDGNGNGDGDGDGDGDGNGNGYG